MGLVSESGMRPTIIVCVNLRGGFERPSCAASGGEAIADALDSALQDSEASVVRIKCFGRCEQGPIVRVAPGGRFFTKATMDDVPAMLDALKTREDDGG